MYITHEAAIRFWNAVVGDTNSPTSPLQVVVDTLDLARLLAIQKEAPLWVEERKQVADALRAFADAIENVPHKEE